MQIILFLFLLLPIVTENLSLFNHNNNKPIEKATISDECCVSSKLNVGSKKANNGREFFRQLSSNNDGYKQINPENMCNLIHFLIQQATLNNQSITFTKGMKIKVRI